MTTYMTYPIGCSDLLYLPIQLASKLTHEIDAHWPRVGTFMGRVVAASTFGTIAALACKLLGVSNSISTALLIGSITGVSLSLTAIIASLFILAIAQSAGVSGGRRP